MLDDENWHWRIISDIACISVLLFVLLFPGMAFVFSIEKDKI